MATRLGRKHAAARMTWCLAALTLIMPFCATAPQGPEPTIELDKLLAERRYFELRQRLQSVEAMAQPEILYIRGRVANAFNRIGESINYLTSYLQAAGTGLAEARLRDVLGALTDDYVKSFQYTKAAETREKMLALLRAGLSPQAVADFQGITSLWRGLRTYPPQSVTILEDTEIAPMGEEGLPVDIAGQTIPFIVDTGSDLSLINRADAERLGLPTLDVRVDISTATGERVAAQGAVVGEMRIGRVVVRNAVFLVVPEQMLYFPDIKKQRRGLLGFPVLAGMKELSLLRTGGLRVPAQPRVQGEPNFFLEKEDPVLETNFLGRRLLFQLDTGAAESQFFPPFFRAFHDRIVRRGVFATENVEGVGTVVTVPTYVINGFSMVIAGRDVPFDRPVPVLTRATDPASQIFYGALGLDLLTHFQALTISYEAMRIVLE